MLSGKDLILATKPFAKEIRGKSWFHLLTTLALLIISYAGIVFIPYVIIRILCSVITSLLMVRTFIIYHDYQHHSILQKSFAANAIMTVFGLYILAPASIWKRSHDHHHKHNSKLFSASIGSYPIATKSKFLRMSAGEKFGYLAIRHPLTIGFGYFTMFVAGMCASAFISSPRKHADALLALILHITASVCIFIYTDWLTWLLVFFVPFLLAFALGAYLFYAQHNFPGVTFYNNEDWAYEKAALESSSYMTMNPIMAWFTGNIGYHHIHHLNARIPFYRLPEAMKKIPELQTCKTTSLSIKDVIACFRLKIWDQDTATMVGLRGIKKEANKKQVEIAI